MEDNPKPHEESALDDSLAFFGAITASVSHELNNVMAIMDQTTGLLEDRLSGTQEEIRITSEKLEKIVTSLQKQAARGLDIIKRLNRFAHSADYARQKFDVGETLQNLIQLIVRLAVLKGVTLDARLPKAPLEIEGNPFYMQQAVFTAVRTVLATAQKGDVITVTLGEFNRKVEVTIEGPNYAPEAGEVDWAELKQVMDRLLAECKIEPAHQTIIIRLLLPG